MAKATEKIKIEIEVDQTVVADYQVMLDELNAACKAAHDQTKDACEPLTISNCSEKNMRDQLLSWEISKAVKKYS